MAETVLVLCENQSRMPHDLPLPDGLAQRVASGEAKILGPCDGDGNLLKPVPEPASVEVPAVKRPAGRPPASSKE